MCMNGYWQPWKKLLTSQMESACTVFVSKHTGHLICAKTEEDNNKTNFPWDHNLFTQSQIKCIKRHIFHKVSIKSEQKLTTLKWRWDALSGCVRKPSGALVRAPLSCSYHAVSYTASDSDSKPSCSVIKLTWSHVTSKSNENTDYSFENCLNLWEMKLKLKLEKVFIICNKDQMQKIH